LKKAAATDTIHIMSPRTKKVLAIILTLGASAVGVCIALEYSRKARPDLLGEEFRDPDLKIVFRLPAQWHTAEAPAEVREVFSKEGSRLVAYFNGPGRADSCSLVAIASDKRLFGVRAEILRCERNLSKKVLQDDFVKINGVPAWINQYGTGNPPFVLRDTRVIFDRGGTKVMLLFTLTARSMRRQEEAIAKSLSTVTLD